MIVDAHQHFLEPERFEYPWIDERSQQLGRAFLPAELEPRLRRFDVAGTVLVQTLASLEETEWLLDLAAATDWIAGVVGWVDLTRGDTAEQIAALRARAGGEHLVGIRHPTHDELDPTWLTRPAVRQGLAAIEEVGLPFDLLLRPRELPAAVALARELPSLRLVVDHIAKPEVAAGWSAAVDWTEAIAELAREPNVCCKLSGLVTEADWQTWTAADVEPFVDHALECFGPGRVVFGSDWPVCELAATYRDVVALAQALTVSLSCDERQSIFASNAVSFYRLDERGVVS